MERSITPYEDRGSEASMADSLGIKDAAKERSKGQRALGIHPTATMEENLTGFQPMKEENEEDAFTREDIEVWLCTLSVLGQCPGLGQRAAEYAQRTVVDEEINKGWLWLGMKKDEWLVFMDEEHSEVLERFGFDRGTESMPVYIATLEAQMTSLQKMVDDQRAGD